MKLFKKIWSSNYFYPVILIFLGIVLAAVNYSPHTFLIGWDSLHPEFNFGLQIERVLTGVWRTDQGLGAIAGHSHMADLPRVIFLWLGSLVIPATLLRYLFFFLCLILGPLGIYKLLDNRRSAAFLAGLVYLTNLGTVQHFNVPFEMFAVAYAAIPWLFYLAKKFIENAHRKRLLLFAGGVILASPMAYAATLWYTTFALLFLFILILAGKKNWKSALILILTTLVLNLYWLAPNLYFVKSEGAQVAAAKVNRLFSPEAFAKNQEFGNITDTIILKNFLFDWQLFDYKTHQFKPVLGPWIEHLNNPLSAGVGYLFFAVAVVGIARVIIKKDKLGLALLPIFLISFLVILNGTWPISDLFRFLSQRFPVVSESLRFPFTKFSLVLMFTVSIYFSLGLNGIMCLLNNPKFKSSLTIILFIAGIWYFWPAFQGNLVNPAMKISIPNEYFQMFEWFGYQNHDARVAVLPINSFWNWTYYDWGYQGAGFLQFGIRQPLLDRDYDRWNPANEQYGREMAYAVYSQNPEIIAQVLTKFNIRFILFDSGVSAPGQTSGSTVAWLIPKLLELTPGVTFVKQFGQNISIYEVNSSKTNADITVKNNLPTVNKSSNGFPFDQNFGSIGDYQSLAFNPLTATADFDHLEHYLGSVGQTLASVAENRLNPLGPCGQTDPDTKTIRAISDGTFRYTSSNGSLCDYFAFPSLNHAQAYAFSVTSKNLAGFPLEICVSNDLTRHCDLFVRLGEQKDFQTETYLLPPLLDYGNGYTVNLNNYAVNGQTSVNEIKSLTISQVSYQIPVQTQSSALNSTGLPEPAVERPNPVFYKAQFNPSASLETNNSVLVLNRAFDTGWIAWDGRNFLTQTLVNNWANGWKIRSAEQRGSANNEPLTIIVFFFPEVLEWLGFMVLPIPFLIACLKNP